MALTLVLAVLLQGTAADDLLRGMQAKYAAARSVSAEFTQTYRAPGIEQRESGVMWVRRPGLMRWEYRDPVAKLFVADGRRAYLYVPEDRQVQLRDLTPSDLRNTPLRFLLGQGDILATYAASAEPDAKPSVPGGVLVRLMPRVAGSEFDRIVLEIDAASRALRRVVLSETGGGTSEFRFTKEVLNPTIKKDAFDFRIPRGVDVIRVDERE